LYSIAADVYLPSTFAFEVSMLKYCLYIEPFYVVGWLMVFLIACFVAKSLVPNGAANQTLYRFFKGTLTNF